MLFWIINAFWNWLSNWLPAIFMELYEIAGGYEILQVWQKFISNDSCWNEGRQSFWHFWMLTDFENKTPQSAFLPRRWTLSFANQLLLVLPHVPTSNVVTKESNIYLLRVLHAKSYCTVSRNLLLCAQQPSIALTESQKSTTKEVYVRKTGWGIERESADVLFGPPLNF